MTPSPTSYHSPIHSPTNLLIVYMHIPLTYSGSMVTGGAALAVVTATGVSTEIGAISAGVAEAGQHHSKTPLAERLG